MPKMMYGTYFTLVKLCHFGSGRNLDLDNSPFLSFLEDFLAFISAVLPFPRPALFQVAVSVVPSLLASFFELVGFFRGGRLDESTRLAVIYSLGDPFEVRDAVVEPVAVDVVHYGLSFRVVVRDKRERD